MLEMSMLSWVSFSQVLSMHSYTDWRISFGSSSTHLHTKHHVLQNSFLPRHSRYEIQNSGPLLTCGKADNGFCYNPGKCGELKNGDQSQYISVRNFQCVCKMFFIVRNKFCYTFSVTKLFTLKADKDFHSVSKSRLESVHACAPTPPWGNSA